MPICFDLDGTLGHFSSGFVLLRQALGEIWGQAPTQDELTLCKGSTDWEIVDDLHRMRFGRGLDEPGYAVYEQACLSHFQKAFAPGGWEAEAFGGVLEGLHRLAQRWPVWLVSGNVPSVLDFKAEVLGIDPAIPRLGSLPRHSRTTLLQRAIQAGQGPHLYVGDRPHDLEAAQGAGLPFIAVGGAVPGEHPCVPADAQADRLVAAVASALGSPW